VLGDSHTYGTAVARDEAWPLVLGASLRRRVYNMGLPGHSPVQSLLALDEALSLQPTHVVVAVHVGNDFPDSFHVSKWSPTIRALAPPDLLRASLAVEEQETFLAKADRLYYAGETWAQPPQGTVAQTRAWLSAHNRLYGLLRAVKNRVRPPPVMVGEAPFESVVQQVTPARLKYWTVTDQPHWRTILTVPYHFLCLDDRDVRVRLGVELVKRALLIIADRTRAKSAQLLVVLLPTKDAVFWLHTTARSALLTDLVAAETRLKRELMQAWAAEGLAVVDATDALRAAPRQPYFETPDSHPSPFGHRVIAEVVAAHLTRSS
jgi:hypothetical protein